MPARKFVTTSATFLFLLSATASIAAAQARPPLQYPAAERSTHADEYHG